MHSLEAFDILKSMTRRLRRWPILTNQEREVQLAFLSADLLMLNEWLQQFNQPGIAWPKPLVRVAELVFDYDVPLGTIVAMVKLQEESIIAWNQYQLQRRAAFAARVDKRQLVEDD